MGIGASLFLIATGAVMAFAVTDNVNGIDLVAVGWILMIVGIVGALLSAIYWSSWGGVGASRTRTRVIERDRDIV